MLKVETVGTLSEIRALPDLFSSALKALPALRSECQSALNLNAQVVSGVSAASAFSSNFSTVVSSMPSLYSVRPAEKIESTSTSDGPHTTSRRESVTVVLAHD
jgi:precorrin-2 methylase